MKERNNVIGVGNMITNTPSVPTKVANAITVVNKDTFKRMYNKRQQQSPRNASTRQPPGQSLRTVTA